MAVERREGVRRNFEALHAATDRLGAVPAMLGAADCFGERGPDDKAVLCYVAHLCARLLEASAEERAAFALQNAWRRRQNRCPGAAFRTFGSHSPASVQGLQLLFFRFISIVEVYRAPFNEV